MDSRDFFTDKQLENIRECMDLLHWTWWDSNYAPTLPQMRTCINELLALLDKTSYVETGGFRAERVRGPRGNWYNKVSFILEQGENDLDDYKPRKKKGKK